MLLVYVYSMLHVISTYKLTIKQCQICVSIFYDVCTTQKLPNDVFVRRYAYC